MSLPLQSNNQPSRSPSKSSLRRISGPGGTSKTVNRNNPSPGPTTHFASEATQHHFLPHSPPNQTLDFEDDEEDALTCENDGSYQTAPQPQPSLQPFFTLIEDTVTNEHFHPTVHYIFADDEPEIITEAACRSLEQEQQSQGAESPSEEDRDVQESHVETRLPPPRPGVREHYIILDVQPASAIPSTPAQQFSDRLPSPSPSSVETAHALPSTKTYPYTVTSAQSLSGDWQVFRTIITDAPTINAEHQSDEKHLMLRIEGRSNSPDNKLVPKRDGETTEDLIERFQTRLAEIRTLMTNLDVNEQAVEGAPEGEGEGEGDLFADGAGLAGIGYHHPTGFGNAVLDEQD